jgi:hypothetical protein
MRVTVWEVPERGLHGDAGNRRRCPREARPVVGVSGVKEHGGAPLAEVSARWRRRGPRSPRRRCPCGSRSRRPRRRHHIGGRHRVAVHHMETRAWRGGQGQHAPEHGGVASFGEQDILAAGWWGRTRSR